jgi:hypothetical protein
MVDMTSASAVLSRTANAASAAARCGLTCVALAVTLTGTAWAQGPLRPVETVVINTPQQPVPVNVVGPVTITPTSAGQPFTTQPVQISVALAGAFVPPDPSGTKYAITSVTVSNSSTTMNTAVLFAIAVENATNNSCRFLSNEVERAAGPRVSVPPGNTVHITFPQPYITQAVSGPNVCLAAAGEGSVGVTWSAVGFKILP